MSQFKPKVKIALIQGIVPFNFELPLPSTLTNSKLVRAYRVLGIVPDSLFPLRFNWVRDASAPNSSGMVPSKLFPS